jgi:N-acetylneuraminate synthase
MARTTIIAEAGVNHDGSVGTALELIDVAADAGADVVKFQTFDVDEVVTADAPQAGYQRERAPASSQKEMLRALVLDQDAHERIAAHCQGRGIEFLSTAFDESSLRRLVDLGIRRVKVPSGELTNGPLLLAIARTQLPLVISTGMATLGEVESALSVIAYGRLHAEGVPSREDLSAAYSATIRTGALAEELTVLHCTSSYPAQPEDVNLAAMDTLAQSFALPVGYSDHTLGIAISLAAVARGASLIEKHITLDRTRPGPDHAASLEPDGLRELIAGIRAIEASIGAPVKYPTSSERDTATVARRSIVAARPISAGASLQPEDLKSLRPGTGTSPMNIWFLVGHEAKRDYQRGEAIDIDQ